MSEPTTADNLRELGKLRDQAKAELDRAHEQLLDAAIVALSATERLGVKPGTRNVKRVAELTGLSRQTIYNALNRRAIDAATTTKETPR